MSKKKLFSLALVVAMIAIISFGTLAWFNDNDEVTNQFYIADSDDNNPDEIFSVNVWETGDNEDDGLIYEDILPGDILPKEVFVENTGYYDQYIRVTVTVSDAAVWMDILNTNGKAPKLEQIVDGYDRNDSVWTGAVGEVVNGSLVYTMYYKHILLGTQDSIYDNTGAHSNIATVFTAVKIPSGMDQDQAADFGTTFNITVKAEAVQTENLNIDRTKGEGAKEAFAFVEENQ